MFCIKHARDVINSLKGLQLKRLVSAAGHKFREKWLVSRRKVMPTVSLLNVQENFTLRELG